MRPPTAPPARAILLGLLVVCVAFAAWVRLGHDQRVWRIAELSEQSPEHAPWFSDEPDGLYHMRRVQRAINEGSVAATDSKLNAPDGAAIPWPPYADWLHARLLAPFVSAEASAKQVAQIETRLAWFPFSWSLLTVALLVGACAYLTRSLLAAGLAGIAFGGQYAAAHYSAPGIADHHAWITLLNTSVLLICMRAWTASSLEKTRASAAWGALAGALIGLSLGSWVASLLWLGGLQLAMLVLLLHDRKRGLVGLRPFALSFHLVAACILLPAVWMSPWRETHPWMVVNLSWFHLVELLLGALCFAVPRRMRMHPACMPLAILAIGVALLALNWGPGAGVREGLAWVSRGDEFMSGIAESEPLLGSSFGSFLTWTSWSYFLLPLAWVALAYEVWRRSAWQFLPVVTLLPLAAIQAFTQIRFAESLAPLAALAFAIAACSLFNSLRLRQASRANSPRHFPQLGQAAVGCLLGIILVPDGALQRASATQPDLARNAHRDLVEWVGQQSASDGPQSVLAPWDWGHAIEWLTPFASVATNFGSYVGESGYRAPARFFLTSDEDQARELLRQHGVRYVIRPSRLVLSLDQLQRSFGEGLRPGGMVVTQVDDRGRERSSFTAAWFETMAARLGIAAQPDPAGTFPGLGDVDGPDGPQSPLGFMRLVAVSPAADQHPGLGGVVQPFGLIWEHVEGARVRASLEPGQILEVELGIQIIDDGQSLLGFLHRDHVAVDALGVAELRVPYNTALPNGQAGVDYARWRILDAHGVALKSGDLFITEEAVRNGDLIEVGR